MKKFRMLFVLVFTLLCLVGCSKENAPAGGEASVSDKELILASTTSTHNSGLFDAILEVFKEETGIEVSVVPVGTGAALRKGRDGDADILLVHAKSAEEEFVENGHGTYRKDVMYNDFVILGPKNDPNNLKSCASDVVKALALLADEKGTFISRGDDSGTHKKEKSLWASAEITPEGDWYQESGQGMGASITMANELQAYIMTDRATYLSMMDNLDLEIVVEKNDILFNQYGIIPVNPDKGNINNEAAEIFVEWITSEKAQKLIGEFGVDKYGQALFTPNAK